jgi:hypothetical protein
MAWLLRSTVAFGAPVAQVFCDMIAGMYKTWRVSRSDREPLLRFIHQGLEDSGCRIIYSTDPATEPFLVTFEMPSGERSGVLCYAFLANSKPTKNRPGDEYRFQVKLGSDANAVLKLHQDPLRLVTTLFVGIDTERQVLVGADPEMHNPTPMFISIEFKQRHVEAIAKDGWHAWERVRRGRGTDAPKEVLVGAARARFLDYVLFERAAKGLDQGHRQLLAEKFLSVPSRSVPSIDRHRLIEELGLSEAALFDLIDETTRLKQAVRGWVAEVHLEQLLRDVPGVTDCARLNAEGKPDISLRYRGRGPYLIECKNVLRDTLSDGTPRLDFQKTRASKADPCSRYYRPSDFSIVAACLHAVTERWEFRYAATRTLPPHKRCAGRIQPTLQIDEQWTVDAAVVLEAIGSA